MSRPTPGPWKVTGNIVDIPGEGTTKQSLHMNSLANARLIAKAPEMLSALQLLVAWSEQALSSGLSWPIASIDKFAEEKNKALALLRKIEGQP